MTRAMPKNRHKKRAIRQGRLLRAYARNGTVHAACDATGVPLRVAQDWIQFGRDDSFG